MKLADTILGKVKVGTGMALLALFAAGGLAMLFGFELNNETKAVVAALAGGVAAIFVHA